MTQASTPAGHPGEQRRIGWVSQAQPVISTHNRNDTPAAGLLRSGSG
jgi:hypothetical protein